MVNAKWLTLGAVTALAGCATVSVNVDPTYVSDETYEALACDQISAELRLAHMRVEYLSNSQDAAARSDAQNAAILPILVRGNANGNVGALSVAKGQRDALVRVATAKACPAR